MASNEPGYVYILTNPSFREDWVKIGKSSRPVDVRSKELDNTAVPLPFEIYATMKTVKYNEAEKLVHRYIERFTNLRIRNNREFFNVKPEEALEIFYEVASLLDDAIICERYKGAKGQIEHQFTKENLNKVNEQKTDRGNRSGKNWVDTRVFGNKNDVLYSDETGRKSFGLQYGYIYGSAPESAIRFSFKVVEADMPYDPIMDRENEFVMSNGASNFGKSNTFFAHMILTGETTNRRLSLANLLERGLKSAPMGAMDISKTEYKELQVYINKNL